MENKTNISTEQSQAFMFAYEQISSVKYIYTSHIPAIYSIMMRVGLPNNEETVEGLRKAIALKFFGDVYIGESNEEINKFLKGLAFRKVEYTIKREDNFDYTWSEGYFDRNTILKCHLYYSSNNPLFED